MMMATPVSTQPLETSDLGQVNKELEDVEIQKDSLNMLDKRDSVSKEEFNLLRSEMAQIKDLLKKKVEEKVDE